MRTIGVLGGMGPEATIALMARVVAAVDASDDADHIPLIVDQNTQVPSRIKALIEGTGESPGPVLGEMAARLEAAGAEALVMACNTAHHYADAITSRAGIPFLNIVDLSVRAAVARSDGAIGVLASPAVAQVGLYDDVVQAAGREILHPDGDAALAVIKAVKAEGPTADAARALEAVAQGLAEKGAATQIVACTEYSLLLEQIYVPDVTLIDAMDVLVDEIVAFAKG
ncbi:aspartate/glutamate racemase family protein [Shimia ponticola]|uniref:aspartate/glutamate racemase family protein n=1 Tax=Shimia ponticola TaxID=2582893 RepID=UPI001C9B6D62|nr:amino acid racemase [Shimia ponticola]